MDASAHSQAQSQDPQPNSTIATTATVETTEMKPDTRASASSSSSSSSTSTTTTASVGNAVSELASTTIANAKEQVSNVNELAQTAWESVRPAAVGQNEQGVRKEFNHTPTPEHSDQIDTMETEKIVEFMQEKHKSNAKKPTTN